MTRDNTLENMKYDPTMFESSINYEPEISSQEAFIIYFLVFRENFTQHITSLTGVERD